MSRYAVLLRGINVGAHHRISMPELRAALADAGFEDVRTYLQSGNVVLSSAARAGEVARACEGLIAERFGLQIAVVVRTHDELAEIVRRNPLGAAAKDPKRLQVSFLDSELAPDVVVRLGELAAEPERFAVDGRQVYAWHPVGVARSKLATMLAGKGLGVTATSRNWTTVTRLLALAADR